MVEAHGARHVDAAMDGMDPGRAGIRDDDARGSENRQAADDAEPRIERLLRQQFATFDGNLYLEVRPLPATSAIAISIMRRGTGLIAGLRAVPAVPAVIRKSNTLAAER